MSWYRFSLISQTNHKQLQTNYQPGFCNNEALSEYNNEVICIKKSEKRILTAAAAETTGSPTKIFEHVLHCAWIILKLNRSGR